MQLTHFAPTTNMLWKHLETSGIDPAPLFRKAGIDPALREDSRARISLDALDRLWEQAIDRLDDPCLGIRMSAYWHPSFTGALGYAWLVSSTLRTAINRAVRYIHVVSEGVNLESADSTRGFRIVIDLTDNGPTSPIFDQQYDVVLAVLMRMCRANCGEALNALEITMRHPRPNCHALFDDYFRSPLVFDADEYSMTFAINDVDRKLLTANKELALLHDGVLMKYLVEIRKGDIVQQIQSLLIDILPSGSVTDQMIAKELHLSERSLQRKLRDKGTSFRLVLESVRKMVAMQYIRNPRNSMGDIAFLLGFSEQSAFSRAFKKWTGTSPIKFRENLDI
jgi:AraC-like DNA-binding protein